MTNPNPHDFQVGRWVRLLKGPHAGRRGQIVSRHGDVLEIFVNRGSKRPISVAIAEVQKAYVDTQSHGDVRPVSSDSRQGSA